MYNEKIKSIIAKQLKIDAKEIKDDTSLKFDLGADSLDFMAIVSLIEDDFKIQVDLTAFTDIDQLTINDISKFIEERQRESL